MSLLTRTRDPEQNEYESTASGTVALGFSGGIRIIFSLGGLVGFEVDWVERCKNML